MTLDQALTVIESLPAPITELGMAAQIVAMEYRELKWMMDGLRK